MSAPRAALLRQWQLVRILTTHRRGITAGQLMERLTASRATLYRDLDTLEAAGVPITREVRNGETRLSIPAGDAPTAEPTASQLHALRLARMALVHLDGSWVTKELDALLRAARPAKGTGARASKRPVSVRPPRPSGEATVLATLEDAIERERGVRFTYRASSRGGEASSRRVDPRKIRAHPDGSTYLIAWDLAAKDWRTFKLVRMANVEMERRAWERHPPLDVFEAASHKALKAWSGGAVRVRIALSKHVAWLAKEYALPGQTVDVGRDGAATVTAEVAGLVEVTRWVLGWGKHARVLEPTALVDAVRTELSAAARQYG